MLKVQSCEMLDLVFLDCYKNGINLENGEIE